MNTLMLQFEWKSLRRNQNLAVLLLVVLGAGIFGIFFGKFEVNKQQRRVKQVQTFEKQQFDSLLNWSTFDTTITANMKKYERAASPTGSSRNRHFTFFEANEAPPMAGLRLGQRDMDPMYYGFNMTDLARRTLKHHKKS